MDLANKIAVVTGGASGLGEATVRRFVSAGAKVAIFDLNDERGEALVSELGKSVAYFNVNVTDEDQVAKAISGVEDTFGPAHICCNFAGIAAGAKVLGKDGPHKLSAFRKVIDINLIGSFNVLRLCAESMMKNDPITEDGQRGVIINTASVAAFEGQIGQAAYSASKGAIVGMTLPIARDLATSGIRCNTIAPGLIHTPLFEALPEPVYESLSLQPLNPRRLGKADEVAKVAQFIVENDYVNGETIRVDGGIRMQPK